MPLHRSYAPGVVSVGGGGGTPADVERFDFIERSVTNGNNYSNDFDFNVVRLVATVTPPSGPGFTCEGFHDGGTTWKVRIRADLAGPYSYTLAWAGSGSPGHPSAPSGDSFICGDTGVHRGPLAIGTDRTWFFEDGRGAPFHARGYGMHSLATASPTQVFVNEVDWIKNLINSTMVANGDNFTLLTAPSNFNKQPAEVNAWDDSFWSSDLSHFDTAVWAAYEEVIDHYRQNGIYGCPFSMTHQSDFSSGQFGGSFATFQLFLRYMIARLHPYFNWLGGSPVWEWTDVMTATSTDAVGQYVFDNDPWGTLLSFHDCAQDAFADWLSFSMPQWGVSTLLAGNNRSAIGDMQISGVGACTATGAVGVNINKPIVASEHLWCFAPSSGNHPDTADDMMRGAWGLTLAGALLMPAEWTNDASGNGVGFDRVRALYDFVFGQTNYRQWVQLNSKVTTSPTEKACSGIAGVEYLIYSRGVTSTITINLADVAGTVTFDVLWFNPATGASQAGSPATVAGGASRSFTSPYGTADTVLFLYNGDGGTTGWTPADIASATLVGWYDADNVTISGSAITQANDLSGNANHATQTDAASRPTIASDARGNYMSFTAVFPTGHHLDLPSLFSGTQARSVFMYVTDGTTALGAGFYSEGQIAAGLPTGTQWRLRRDSSTGTLRIEINNAAYTSAFNLGLGDTVRMIGCTFEGTQLQHHTLWHNGSSEAATGTTAVNTTANPNSIGIEGSNYSAGQFQLREAIVCQGKMSDTEIGQLLTYFEARWAAPPPSGGLVASAIVETEVDTAASPWNITVAWESDDDAITVDFGWEGAQTITSVVLDPGGAAIALTLINSAANGITQARSYEAHGLSLAAGSKTLAITFSAAAVGSAYHRRYSNAANAAPTPKDTDNAASVMTLSSTISGANADGVLHFIGTCNSSSLDVAISGITETGRYRNTTAGLTNIHGAKVGSLAATETPGFNWPTNTRGACIAYVVNPA